VRSSRPRTVVFFTRIRLEQRTVYSLKHSLPGSRREKAYITGPGLSREFFVGRGRRGLRPAGGTKRSPGIFFLLLSITHKQLVVSDVTFHGRHHEKRG